MAFSMLSDVALPRDPQSSSHAATKNYVDLQDALYQTYSPSAPTSPPLGGLWTDTSASPRLYLKQWNGSSWVTVADTNVLVAEATYVNVAGDTMTGYLTLHADPSNSLHAATKQYVDLRALQTIDLTAGNGLTGGGDLSANRAFNVGAGTGITVNVDDVAVNRTVVDTWYSASGHNHDATYVNVNGDTMTNFLTLHANPTSDLHAATKQYVDITAQGFTFKQAVRVVSTTNITLSGLQTIDGVTLVANNRVLVAGQTNQVENGIYIAAAGSWTRATDADASGELIDGALVPVAQGNTYADTQFICTSVGSEPWVPNTNISVWTRYSGLQDLVAGNGLTKTGNQIDFVAGNTSLTVSADSVVVAHAPKWSTGQTITLTGDISGTSTAWDGSAGISFATSIGAGVIVDADINATANIQQSKIQNLTGDLSSKVPTSRSVIAGDGLTGGGVLTADVTLNVVGDANLNVTADQIAVLSAPKWTTTRTIALTGAVTGSTTIDGSGNITIDTTGGAGAGTVAKYAQTISGGSTTETITHNLGTKDVSVTLYDITTGAEVGVENTRPTINTVVLTFVSAPAAGSYRVVVLG